MDERLTSGVMQNCEAVASLEEGRNFYQVASLEESRNFYQVASLEESRNLYQVASLEEGRNFNQVVELNLHNSALKKNSALRDIPLFLGLTPKDIEEITRSAHLRQRHYKRGTTILEAGTACDGIIIVTDGWIEADTYAADRSYHITELLEAPQALEADKLFGLTPRYQATYRALTPCHTITLPKDTLTELLSRHVIVRINLMNHICRRAQQQERLPWQPLSADPRQRIAQFIRCRCRYPAGKKTLHIKMTQLAALLGHSRLDISRALNAMARDEKIILRRGTIEVPALQLL